MTNEPLGPRRRRGTNRRSMTIRLPLKLRDAANAKAEERDENLSEVIREFLQWYVDENARIEYELN